MMLSLGPMAPRPGEAPRQLMGQGGWRGRNEGLKASRPRVGEGGGPGGWGTPLLGIPEPLGMCTGESSLYPQPRAESARLDAGG